MHIIFSLIKGHLLSSTKVHFSFLHWVQFFQVLMSVQTCSVISPANWQVGAIKLALL